MKHRVEFMGLAGAGKTRAATALLAGAGKASVKVFSRGEAVDLALRRRNDGLLKNILKSFPEAVWKRFLGTTHALPELQRFCAANPALNKMLFAALERHSEDDEDRAIVQDTLFHSFIEHTLLEEHMSGNESVVMDEGLAQRTFTLFGLTAGLVEPAEVCHFVDALPAPDFIVRMSTAPAICLERIRTRPRGPRPWFRRLEAGEQLHRLEEAAARLEVIAGAFEKRGVSVTSVDGSPGAPCYEESIEALAALLKG